MKPTSTDPRTWPAAACLIITNNFPPRIGGAGEVYASLAAAAGGRIVVLCATHGHLTDEEVAGWRQHDAAAPYPVHRIRSIRPALQGGGAIPRLVEDVAIRARLLAAVVSLHRRYRFGAACIADDETVGWLMPPLRLLGCRVVLYTHGDDLAVRPGRLHQRRRGQFARADAIVAVSAASAEELSRGFGVPRARVTVIPNGVDLDLFHPLPVDVGLRDSLGIAGRRVFATVTRLVPRKGVDRVIASLSRVRAAVPDAHYLLIGDGPQLPELRDQAAQVDAGDMISFVGAVPHQDVPRYLRLSELMVMPNRRMPDGEEDG
ncbi:MAG: glycosyltransferase family 4 protein, partial [Acetobacteraceae bacterium]